MEIAPNDSQCYLYLSVAVGSRTQTEGNKKKIELAVVVKNVANRAVELDPGNHYAHYILARWHHNLANVSGVLSVMAKLIYGGLPPASNQQAIHHFQQAVKHEPDNITYRLEFARASLTIKKWQLAQQQLDQIQLLEAKIYADRQLKIEAEQMRTKVGKHTKFKTHQNQLKNHVACETHASKTMNKSKTRKHNMKPTLKKTVKQNVNKCKTM